MQHKRKSVSETITTVYRQSVVYLATDLITTGGSHIFVLISISPMLRAVGDGVAEASHYLSITMFTTFTLLFLPSHGPATWLQVPDSFPHCFSSDACTTSQFNHGTLTRAGRHSETTYMTWSPGVYEVIAAFAGFPDRPSSGASRQGPWPRLIVAPLSPKSSITVGLVGFRR
ncbi:hypothetical protein LIA77_03380 [Sarocladium implicatum]|nr:hypothetical protein LIA77_03380 [Sarocladium implicatum]